jgi:hypothetical protein
MTSVQSAHGWHETYGFLALFNALKVLCEVLYLLENNHILG